MKIYSDRVDSRTRTSRLKDEIHVSYACIAFLDPAEVLQLLDFLRKALKVGEKKPWFCIHFSFSLSLLLLLLSSFLFRNPKQSKHKRRRRRRKIEQQHCDFSASGMGFMYLYSHSLAYEGGRKKRAMKVMSIQGQ